MQRFSSYDCEFDQDTVERVRKLFGERSDAFKAARSGDARGLVKLLNIKASATCARIPVEDLQAVADNPAALRYLSDKLAATKALAHDADKEWLRKCPKEAARRKLEQHRIDSGQHPISS